MSNPRPSFQHAWAASRRIYSRFDPLGLVAGMIGGKVQYNIEKVEESQRWKNTCAVRMSYILNETGTLIPPSGSKTVSGKNGRWYFYRVKDLIGFLEIKWGSADNVVKQPSLNNPLFEKRNGLMLFDVQGWSDAGGHATLWSSTQSACYDSCYFNTAEALYKTNRLLFWELK